MSAHHHAFQQTSVLADSNLPAKHDIFLNHNAARKPRLSGHDHVFAQPAVVSDVYQVIDLRSAADALVFKTIGCVGEVGEEVGTLDLGRQTSDVRLWTSGVKQRK